MALHILLVGTQKFAAENSYSVPSRPSRMCWVRDKVKRQEAYSFVVMRETEAKRCFCITAW